MWLLVFAGIAQGALLGERILNRVVKLFVPSTRSPTKELADRMVLSAFFSHVWACVFAAFGLVAQAHVLILQNALGVAAAVALMGILTLLSDSSSFIYVVFYNTYNSGIGYMIHVVFLAPLKIADAVIGGLLPLYNAVVYIIKTIIIRLLIPLLMVNVEQMPALVQNLGLFFGACSVSVVDFVASVVQCLGIDNFERMFWTASERLDRVVRARACARPRPRVHPRLRPPAPAPPA